MAQQNLNDLSHKELVALATELQGKLNDQEKSQEKNSNKNDQQERYLRETLDILPAIFYSKRLDGSYLMVNKAYRELFNLTNEQIIDKTDHELFPKEFADVFRKNDLEIAASQKAIETEEKALGDDGKERFYHSFKFPYFDKAGNVWATGGISLDITEKKQFERQAFHNSKLASIGELAAGVGHEINNPLSIIMCNLDILQNSLQKNSLDPEKATKKITSCLNASKRITNIVNGLRTFARDDSDVVHDFNIHEMLNESISMIEDIYHIAGVQIINESHKASESIIIQGNRGKIQQLFINLIANAKDATKDKESRKISIKTELNDKILSIAISDNGCGITPEIEQRIFDPFFTTKGVNEGTGIGLGLAANIAKEHGGSIKVASKVGEGSTFTVELPINSTLN